MNKDFSRVLWRTQLVVTLALSLTGAACHQDGTSSPPGADTHGQGIIHISVDGTGDVKGAKVTAYFYGARQPVWMDVVPRDGCVSFETVPSDFSAALSDKNAGAITATAGNVAVPLVLHPGRPLEATWYDETSSLPADLPVSIHATGADVPEFTVTAQPPSALKLETRTTDGLSKDSDYELTWEPTASADDVLITFTGKGRELTCQTTSNRGRFVVPSDQLRPVIASPFRSTDQTLLSRSACGASCV